MSSIELRFSLSFLFSSTSPFLLLFLLSHPSSLIPISPSPPRASIFIQFLPRSPAHHWPTRSRTLVDHDCTSFPFSLLALPLHPSSILINYHLATWLLLPPRLPRSLDDDIVSPPCSHPQSSAASDPHNEVSETLQRGCLMNCPLVSRPILSLLLATFTAYCLALLRVGADPRWSRC